MEHSINLEYLKQISFNDPKILLELIEEWKFDTNKRLEELSTLNESSDSKRIFNTIHSLKTNFFMLGCSSLIKECEFYLKNDFPELSPMEIYNKLNKEYLLLLKQLE